MLRPRWHLLERVAHRIGDSTCVRLHECVNLQGSIGSRATQWEETEGTHGQRLRVSSPRPISAPIAPSMAPAVFIVLSFVYEAKAVMVELLWVLNNACGYALGE